ncbi:putative DNA repair protein [Trypanosoma rangeli]|uniref:Crossover junction endonuclease MUS81 n=1 Tax=Trypanosoma rangeli TaxID=5698 RepID=A0A422N053_TRYRA|nr:putative DNA repair protein [Trypanosoma rangeli]RNE98831.1 putative DNA repair protein [Trypanosoma rangeli]|eukprot:RNE98831.1 putative DNA repair protein [Trypanosoma rangeli]
MHNELLACHMERAWPRRFAEFCTALRRYPLPVTSGAAATVLRGGSADAVRAVDAYCCGALQRRQAPECGGAEVGVTSPSPSLSGTEDRTTAFSSPFRCFKLRRLEGGASLPRRPRQGGSPDKAAGSGDDGDVLLTLPDLSCPPRGELCTGCPLPLITRCGADAQPMVQQLSLRELRSRCASLGLLTAGTKKVLFARLRQHEVVQQSGPPSQQGRTGEVQPQLPVEDGGAGGTSPRRFTLTQEEQLEHSQRLRTPFLSPSTGRQPPSPSREHPRACRLVGTPQEFVAALMHDKRRENGVGGSLAHPALDEMTAQWQWRVLVDNRERIHGTHESVIKAFVTAGVPAASCTLPCGDFLLGIDVPGEACGIHGTHPTAKDMRNPSAIHLTAAAGGGGDAPAQKLFSVVVERKTVKDLCASIATPRYYEQRRLLSVSPFRSVVWVVEGGTELLRPDERRRVLSACASLAAVPRFRVVRTRHLKDTISWLRSLGVAYVTALEKAVGRHARPPQLADCTACINVTARIKRALRARTTFARMLMCVRGCSSGLATRLACKYGSLLHMWRRLRQYGREACDADLDVRRLSNTQRDVYVRLTEFLLAEEYC